MLILLFGGETGYRRGDGDQPKQHIRSGGVASVRVNFQVWSQPRKTNRTQACHRPKPKPIDAADGTMADFLSRESNILGGQFSSSDDIDFDRAASAFPDISLDGTGDIPTPTLGGAPALSQQTSTSSFGDFDDFATPPPHADVKVTGDDEIEQFESQFPDIDVPVVSANANTRLLIFVLMTLPSLHLQ